VHEIDFQGTSDTEVKTFRAHRTQKSLQNDLKECQDDGLDFEHVDKTINLDDVFRAFRSNSSFNYEDKVELVISDFERVLSIRVCDFRGGSDRVSCLC
jgi:hypothetical protein